LEEGEEEAEQKVKYNLDETISNLTKPPNTPTDEDFRDKNLD